MVVGLVLCIICFAEDSSNPQQRQDDDRPSPSKQPRFEYDNGGRGGRGRGGFFRGGGGGGFRSRGFGGRGRGGGFRGGRGAFGGRNFDGRTGVQQQQQEGGQVNTMKDGPEQKTNHSFS